MITILVVEDDESVRLLTKVQINSLYKVLGVPNGEEALEVLDHTHVDLLIFQSVKKESLRRIVSVLSQ